ncbi:hypothetical protein QJS10_CPA07g00462 [Acorus calamus]|uniref:Myb/SANT-like DNA-binding domain-containing protein n=1 Tax=Acorus calamus TaxID=4465 RepID=A0AAV9EIX5_ACOCL|nr:hypothetical protein QJS10_CPA07g00462 [Acorus calamus]
MDDMEDDARYPPSNPHQTSFRPSHRSKIPLRPHHPSAFPPPYAASSSDDEGEDDDDEEEEEEEEEEPPMNGYDHAIDQSDSDSESRDDSASPDSRGKRRRLDRFEFVPRAQPQPPPPPPPSELASPTTDWSEQATFALLEAWGDLYLQNGRKSLRSDEWAEVAVKVSRASKMHRTDAQCRTRLDTLKKRYKKEKSRESSKWVFFKKIDMLMSSRQMQPPTGLACGVDSGEYVFTDPRVYVDRSDGFDELRDSPGPSEMLDDDEDDDDEALDGFPPIGPPSSFGVLADSIKKFGEIYEKVENSRREQMKELEKMREEFQRDLEVQKRKILEEAQVKMESIREGQGGDGEDCDEDTEGSAENISG